MNKKVLIIIGVIIVLGLTVYFMVGKKDTSDQAVSNINNRLADDSKMAPTQSLKDLILGSKALKCNYKDNNTESTFYMADKKMRSDSQLTTEGKAFKNHTIMIDKTSYVWNEGDKTGFKMTVPDINSQVSTTPSTTGEKSEIDLNKKANYNCGDWSKDESLFELPVGVEFKDLSSLIPTTPQASAQNEINPNPENKSIKSSQCLACDSAPAESRAQCKIALGCN